MKRGDIRILGVASYVAPLLSTAYLVLAGYAVASTSLVLAAVLVAGGGLLAAKDMIGTEERTSRGSQSFAAVSKCANSNPGATVQPTSVQSPSVSAACQWPAGTTPCGRSPIARSGPSFMRRTGPCSPAAISSTSGAPA